MDESYKTALTVLVPLNHERYRDYFNQFAALNLGVFLAIATQFRDRAVLLSWCAIALNVLWFVVQLKIALDIKTLSAALRTHEDAHRITIGIKDNQAWRMGASWVMLAVPVLFIFIHLAFLLHPPAVVRDAAAMRHTPAPSALVSGDVETHQSAPTQRSWHRPQSRQARPYDSTGSGRRRAECRASVAAGSVDASRRSNSPETPLRGSWRERWVWA